MDPPDTVIAAASHPSRVQVQRARDIFSPTGETIGVVRLNLDERSVAEHTHDFLVVEFVTAGEGWHVTELGSRPVRRGSVVVVRPGVRHTYAVDDRLELSNLCLRAELLHDELSWVLDYPQLALALLGAEESLATVAEDRLEWILETIRRLDSWIGRRPESVLLGASSGILSELADLQFSPSATNDDVPISTLVRDAMLHFVRDPAAEWSMTMLAQILNTSESSVYRQFRRQTGASPLEWLTQFRAERAATLLSQTDMPIAAVGRLVGWTDPNYFSRRFRSVFGVRPSEHRRRSRAGAHRMHESRSSQG